MKTTVQYSMLQLIMPTDINFMIHEKFIDIKWDHLFSILKQLKEKCQNFTGYQNNTSKVISEI